MFARRNFRPACPFSVWDIILHRSPVSSFKANHDPQAPEPQNKMNQSSKNQQDVIYWYLFPTKTWPKQQNQTAIKICRFWCKEQSDIKPSGTRSPARKSVIPDLHNVCKAMHPIVSWIFVYFGKEPFFKLKKHSQGWLIVQNQVSCLMCKPPPPARNMPCL